MLIEIDFYMMSTVKIFNKKWLKSIHLLFMTNIAPYLDIILQSIIHLLTKLNFIVNIIGNVIGTEFSSCLLLNYFVQSQHFSLMFIILVSKKVWKDCEKVHESSSIRERLYQLSKR